VFEITFKHRWKQERRWFTWYFITVIYSYKKPNIQMSCKRVYIAKRHRMVDMNFYK
jgi:hypothetical protein